MKNLLHRLQAALTAHGPAINTVRDTEEQLAAARAALDEYLRAKNDAANIIDTMTGDDRQAHIDRMERAMADAYANGHDASEYFFKYWSEETDDIGELPGHSLDRN
jgi:hypothetical protein